jgi:hypothetical protein
MAPENRNGVTVVACTRTPPRTRPRRGRRRDGPGPPAIAPAAGNSPAVAVLAAPSAEPGGATAAVITAHAGISRRPRCQRGGHAQRRVTRHVSARPGSAAGRRPSRAVYVWTCRIPGMYLTPVGLRCGQARPFPPCRPPAAPGQVQQGADLHRYMAGIRQVHGL